MGPPWPARFDDPVGAMERSRSTHKPAFLLLLPAQILRGQLSPAKAGCRSREPICLVRRSAAIQSREAPPAASGSAATQTPTYFTFN
jgi:hypothetical protein